jgi:Protein of unknown function (DUF2877)
VIAAAAVSIGYALDLDAARGGVVHSVYAHAVNLAVGGDLWTLLDAERSDMPFGIRIGSPAFGMLHPRVGDRVTVRSGFVGIASGTAVQAVDCRAAARWRPQRPVRLAAHLGHRVDVVRRAVRGRSWIGAPSMARAVSAALGKSDDLGPVVGRVVGRGPGATPSGDDVLAGVLAVLTAPAAGQAGAAAARSLWLSILPLLRGTTDLSAHLLRQAAEGLISRPLQELIDALVADTQGEQMVDILQRVIDTGATSGADSCMGVLAVAPVFFCLMPKGPKHEHAFALLPQYL